MSYKRLRCNIYKEVSQIERISLHVLFLSSIMRNILLLTVLSSLAFIPSLSYSEDKYSQDKKISRIKKSVFPILCDEQQGTAFYIGNNFFVTNAHVVLPTFLFLSNTSTPIEEIVDKNPNLNQKISDSCIIGYKGFRSLKSIHAIDFTNDLAVLRMNDQDLENIKEELIPLELGTSDFKNTEGMIYFYGFPGGNDYLSLLQLSYAKIHPRDVTFFDSETFETFVKWPWVSGASGSPVLMNGKVIGILHSTIGINLTHSTRSNNLIQILKNPIKKPILTFYGLTKEFLLWKKEALKNFLKDWRPFIAAHSKERILGKNSPNLPKEHLEKLKKLLERTPDSKVFWFHFLASYGIAEKNTEVLDTIEKFSTELETISHPSILYQLGFYYLYSNVYKSIEYFNKSSDQHMGLSQYIIALCYFADNDFVEYKNYIQKAIAGGIMIAHAHFDIYNLSLEEFRKNNKVNPLPLSNEPKVLMENFVLKYNFPMPASAPSFIELFTKYLDDDESLSCKKTD